jgi:hypothetical protein
MFLCSRRLPLRGNIRSLALRVWDLVPAVRIVPTDSVCVFACYAAAFWSWSVMTIVMLALFCGPDRRLLWLLILGYLGMLPAMGVLLELAGAPTLAFADVVGPLIPKDLADLPLSFASSVMGQPVLAKAVAFSPHLQPIVFWSLGAVPMIIPFLAFNRLIRGTVGPLFFNVALIVLLSTFLVNDLVLNTSRGLWFVAQIKRILGPSSYGVLTAISFTLSAVVAWFGLRWIARRYRRRQLSVLFEWFGPLLEHLRQMLECHFRIRVEYNRSLALPGFHLFFGEAIEGASRACPQLRPAASGSSNACADRSVNRFLIHLAAGGGRPCSLG